MVSIHLLWFLWLLHTSIGEAVDTVAGVNHPEFIQKRRAIMRAEEAERVGAHLHLSRDEQKISDLLKTAKSQEILSARDNGTIFPPAVSFFISRNLLKNSTVLDIIKRMPKGGDLHVHDSAMVDLDWVISNISYRDNCYMCIDKDGRMNFHFFQSPPSNPDCPWQSVRELRQNSGNAALFDQYIYNNLSIIVPDPEVRYPTINDVWGKFSNYFDTIWGLRAYAPAFRDYVWKALLDFRADNVQYIELRGSFSQTYELDGTFHSREHTLKLYRNITREFIQQYPDFSGIKFIISGSRFASDTSMLQKLNMSIDFCQQHPDMVRGFDLVGQEGPGHPLLYYLDELLYPGQQDPPINLHYFFHAGETDWQGTLVDENLIDAVLLNTSRIGHGFALFKHPEVLKMIKQKGIAVEVNPISNQVLKLVADLRNHGAISLIAEDYPVVICSDDPAVWGALPLSHDFYMAYMAMASEDTDLTLLKQLAKNSIIYSAMDQSEQNAALRLWQQNWDKFVRETVRVYFPDNVPIVD